MAVAPATIDVQSIEAALGIDRGAYVRGDQLAVARFDARGLFHGSVAAVRAAGVALDFVVRTRTESVGADQRRELFNLVPDGHGAADRTPLALRNLICEEILHASKRANRRVFLPPREENSVRRVW